MARASADASRRQLRHAAIAALACCVVAYASVVSFGFAYDDSWTIVNNRALDGPLAPLVRSLFTGKAIARHVPDATRPLMVVSMWVDKRLFGASATGYHVHSLLLYGVVSVAACLATFAVSRRHRAALWGGALFAVFPVHAEVVASVNYREDLYAALAVFGAVAWAFWPRKRADTVDSAVFVSALVVAGLFAKESAVAVVPVVLAVALSTRWRALPRWFSPRRKMVLAVTVVVLAYVVYRLLLRRAGLDDVPLTLEVRGPADRLFRTFRYLARVTFAGLLPVSWSPEYAPDPPASWWWAIAAACILSATVALSRGSRFHRVLAAGLAVAFVGGLPTSPLVGPINETTDRYVFVSTLGGAIVWGTLFERATRRLVPRWRAAAWVLAVVPLAFVSHRAAAPWRSDLDLWKAAVERAPDSPRSWTGWASLLRARGDLDGADAAVARAIELGPSAIRPRVTRIYNLLARGKVDEAKAAIAQLGAEGHARAAGLRAARRCAELGQLAAAACVRDIDKRRATGGSSKKEADSVPREDIDRVHNL